MDDFFANFRTELQIKTFISLLMFNERSSAVYTKIFGKPFRNNINLIACTCMYLYIRSVFAGGNFGFANRLLKNKRIFLISSVLNIIQQREYHYNLGSKGHYFADEMQNNPNIEPLSRIDCPHLEGAS